MCPGIHLMIATGVIVGAEETGPARFGTSLPLRRLLDPLCGLRGLC